MDAKTICKKKFIPPRTNLGKINIETNFGRTMKRSYPKKSSFNIYYDGIPADKIKKKGAGSYGSVYIVEWDENTCRVKGGCSVAIKIPIRDPFWEIEVISLVLHEYRHNIIPYHVIYDQWSNPFVIMQEANGDVFDLLDLGISSRFRNKIIRHYVSAINDLWKRGIVFSDMKSENLLYQCYRTGPEDGMALFFGDIGSFSRKGDEEYGYEVDPPESPDKVNENLVLFTIGLLIISVYDFKYERPKRDKLNSFVEKFYNPLKDQINKYIGNKKLASLTLKLISWDSRYRDVMKVDQVTQEIWQITTSQIMSST